LLIEVGLDLADGRLVALLKRKLQQFGGVAQAGGELVQRSDYRLQLRTFLAESLGLLGVVPDVGIFQFPFDFS